MISSYYAIVREPQFDKDSLTIAGNYQRLSQLEEAIDWALARDPQRFTKLHKDGFYVWRTIKLLDQFPSVLILYKIDEAEKCVTLIRMKEVEED